MVSIGFSFVSALGWIFTAFSAWRSSNAADDAKHNQLNMVTLACAGVAIVSTLLAVAANVLQW